MKKLSLIAAFIPWVLFSIWYVPNSNRGLLVALIALVVLILSNYQELKKGFVLPWGGLLFFSLTAMNDWSSFSSWWNQVNI